MTYQRLTKQPSNQPASRNQAEPPYNSGTDLALQRLEEQRRSFLVVAICTFAGRKLVEKQNHLLRVDPTLVYISSASSTTLQARKTESGV